MGFARRPGARIEANDVAGRRKKPCDRSEQFRVVIGQQDSWCELQVLREARRLAHELSDDRSDEGPRVPRLLGRSVVCRLDDGTGRVIWRLVPFPSAGRRCKVPPNRCTRSRMFTSPLPAEGIVLSSKPLPSSTTLSVSVAPLVTRTVTFLA